MVQMKVVGGALDLNLANAKELIRQAAEHGAQLALLPEAMDFGWTHSSAETGAGSIPGGKSFKVLSNAAKENNIYVCAGIVERDEDKIYNSAVIIDRNGELLLKHRKLNELDFAQKLYNLGNQLKTADTELGNLGLLICADATAQDFTLAKSLGVMGADIILSPSAWAVPPDHDNVRDPYGSLWLSAYKPISKIFNVWYVGVSNVGKIEDGEWSGWNCIGNSLAIDTDGNIALQGPFGVETDTILYVNITLKQRPARGTG
jgi:predicted amidohydrolase